MPPDAEFISARRVYLDSLRTRYDDLEHTNALVRRTTGDIPPLRLCEIFEPQQVRAERRQTELPREVWRRLIANGQLSERDTPTDVDTEQLERESKAYADSSPRPVLEVISEPDNDRIVVLGDPGAGKSTLATYLTLAMADIAPADGTGAAGAGADGHRLARLVGYLPLFIQLRTYDPGAQDKDWTFLDEIGRPSKPGHPPLTRQVLEPYLDQSGRALVIFDGLDEVFDQEQRKDIKWKINYFAARYPGVRVLVTSRGTDYEPERALLDRLGFAHFALQDFDEEQVPRFVRNFYRAEYPGDQAKAAALAARLDDAVKTSPAIAELAGNPMLLTTLALLGRKQSLPRNRRIALKHTVELLVEGWDAEKSLEKYLQPRRDTSQIESLHADSKEDVLRLVARRVQEGKPGSGGLRGNYLSGDALTELFAAYFEAQGFSRNEPVKARNLANVLVGQLRNRDYILARFGDNMFGFVHRALLEYLVAEDFLTRFNGRKLEQSDIEELFRNHSTAPEWQEILLLLTGMLPEGFDEKAIVALLRSNPLWHQSSDPMPRHVFLAIRCLGGVRNLYQAGAASRAVIDALIAVLETVSEPTDYPLAVALTQILERDVLPVLAGIDLDPADRQAFQTWYLARGQFLRGDAPGFAATAAARIYVTLLGRNNQARDRLSSLARWADSVVLRGAALEALALGWCDEPENAELIKESAAADPHWYVRREAVRTFASRWPGTDTTRNLLCTIMTNDDAPEVSGTALRWLVSGWREPKTASLLRWAGANPAVHEEVRAAAVAKLAAGWHDEEQTGRWLWDRAGEKDARVRAAAAEALAAGWHDDPDVRPWLHRHTASPGEHHAQVRVAAVRALAAGWPEEQDTTTLLKAKARTGGDDDPAVRQAAVEALAATCHRDAGTEQWLRQQAASELEPDVRCAAMQALAAYWPGHAETTDLLEDYAVSDPDWYVRFTALQALADSRTGQPGFGNWLRERATQDESPYVRRVALSTAVAGWFEDQQTRPWLCDRAADGQEDPDVRGAAIQALAAGWSEPPMPELLRTLGEGGPRTGAMRRVAVRLVAAGWRDDAQAHPWLHQRAREDESPTVRRTALQLLAAGIQWHDDPATVALLRDRAVGDGSPEVRRAAIQTLSAGWRDDSETGAWLRGDGFDGNNRLGKVAVIRALATDWHDDPATLGWLRDHAAADPHREVQRAAARWLGSGFRTRSEII